MMLLPSWKKIMALLAMFLLGSLTACEAQGADEGPLHATFVSMKEKFDSLGSRSKFAVGAAGGFVVTRFALGTAMTAVKVGALAYVT